MKLYLNDKERSLEFLRMLEAMIQEGSNSNLLDLPSTDKIYQVKGVADPVLEFIEYYIVDAGMTSSFTEGRINWIVNALYSAKGAPQIFDIFQEAFGISIKYDYNFPIIEILKFDDLVITDVTVFVDKFKSMIYHLIYYTGLNFSIENLIINLSSMLTQYVSIATHGFVSREVKLSTNRL